MTTIVLNCRPGFRQTPNTFCMQILNSHLNVVIFFFQNEQSAVGLLPAKKTFHAIEKGRVQKKKQQEDIDVSLGKDMSSLPIVSLKVGWPR